MKETAFINQNKKKWAEFEKMSKQSINDPDKVSQLFVEITDDLAYARTHYSKRSVRVYLNSLAQQVFYSIYKKKREPLSRLIQFWISDLPLEMYRSRKALLGAFSVLIIGMVIGIISTIDDPDFLGAVIGYDYVDLTESNIKEGKPMEIYGSGKEIDSFLMIAINNLRVALITFVLGLFYSVGSGVFLFFNGIMVGAFQWFFKVRGLLMTSFLTIWIHGAFEIPAIVLAGTAGITMGNGLVFPKTLTRLQSLSISAKRGVKIMIGIIPIIIIAAFIEGFATRHTVISIDSGVVSSEWPTAIKWLIILGSFSFMVFYFVIYPYIVARKTNFNDAITDTPSYIQKKEIKLYKIRDFGEVFSDSVLLFSRNLSKNFKVQLITLPLFIFGTIYYYNYSVYGGTQMTWFQNMIMTFSLDSKTFSLVYFSILAITLSINFTSVYFNIYKITRPLLNKKEKLTFFVKNTLKALPITMSIILGLGYLPGIISLLSLLILPFILMPLSYGILENGKLYANSKNGFVFAKIAWGKSLGISVIITLLIFMIGVFPFIIGVENPLEGVIGMVLDWFLLPLTDNYFLITNCIWAIVYYVFFNTLINLYFSAYSILYYSIKEQEDAVELKEEVKQFATRSKTYESEEDGVY